MNPPNLPPLDAADLPAGIRARFITGVNGLRMHLLEAGQEDSSRPCHLLLHGFPELAYSWRKVMPALTKAGYHVVAPDLRGYGRNAAGPVAYDEDLPAALDAEPKAAASFATLAGANRYAVIYRVNDAKTARMRAERVAKFVEMLARSETLHPSSRRKAEVENADRQE